MLGKVHGDMLTGTFRLTQGGRVLNIGHTHTLGNRITALASLFSLLKTMIDNGMIHHCLSESRLSGIVSLGRLLGQRLL